LSLSLQEAEAPLLNLEEGLARGVLTIHEGQVGPSPLSQQFLRIAEQIHAIIEKRPFSSSGGFGRGQWLYLPQQEVAFEMRDGRVHHRRLELLAQDVVIRTTGSVAFDETLDLMVEVPIQDEWVGSDRILASLRGQVVRIPIRGRLSQPKMDGRVLEQLGTQILGGAASRLLEDELSRGLQRLFGPRKPNR
jgi:hypothetical protein